MGKAQDDGLGPSWRRLLIGAFLLGLPVPAPPAERFRRRAAVRRWTVLLSPLQRDAPILPGQGTRRPRLGHEVDRTPPALGADGSARRRTVGHAGPGRQEPPVLPGRPGDFDTPLTASRSGNRSLLPDKLDSGRALRSSSTQLGRGPPVDPHRRRAADRSP